MTLQWSLQDVATHLDGAAVGDDVAVTAVSTDSRVVAGGALFVALCGERYDGHDFVDVALAGGAGAVLVNRGAATDAQPRVEVADTGVALRDLAALHRGELAGTSVIAVTGSSGKTSTKDLLGAALPGAVSSHRSFNNEVGVPLTVLGTDASSPYLVVEVGARGRGHIEWLMPAVKPDISVITNVGVAHLESFGSVAELVDAKWELVEALDEQGTAVLPAGDDRLRRRRRGATMTFGYEPSADVNVSRLVIGEDGHPEFTLGTPEGQVRIRLAMAGEHNAVNAAAAAAAGLAAGVSLDTLASGLETAKGSPWRMEIHRGRYTVVNDAYNANPDSMLAALRMVAQMPGRRVAALGRMAELGDVEVEEHRRVGRQVRELGFEKLVTVGSDPGMADGAGDIAVAVADIDEAFASLTETVRDGDVVLVKASRAIGLERLAERLAEEAST